MQSARPASSADAPPSSALPGMRLTELLAEVQERLDAVGRTQGRIQHLLDAFLSVSTGLDLDTTLRRIVEAGVALVDARYGALGVLRDGGGLARSSTSASTTRPARAWATFPREGGARSAHHRALSAADPRPEPAPFLGRLPPEPPPCAASWGFPCWYEARSSATST